MKTKEDQTNSLLEGDKEEEKGRGKKEGKGRVKKSNRYRNKWRRAEKKNLKYTKIKSEQTNALLQYDKEEEEKEKDERDGESKEEKESTDIRAGKWRKNICMRRREHDQPFHCKMPKEERKEGSEEIKQITGGREKR